MSTTWICPGTGQKGSCKCAWAENCTSALYILKGCFHVHNTASDYHKIIHGDALNSHNFLKFSPIFLILSPYYSALKDEQNGTKQPA